jgi:hypothetical protein
MTSTRSTWSPGGLAGVFPDQSVAVKVERPVRYQRTSSLGRLSVPRWKRGRICSWPVNTPGLVQNPGDRRCLQDGGARYSSSTFKFRVVVDEASLAGTFALDTLTEQARNAGAKVVLVGDWAQLSPVEAGGAFHLLVHDRDLAPELADVRRVHTRLGKGPVNRPSRRSPGGRGCRRGARQDCRWRTRVDARPAV